LVQSTPPADPEGENDAVGSSGPGHQPKQGSAVDAKTVQELVEEAKFHTEFEQSRGETTNQRAGWLLALNGVILGLVANQAREMLTQSTLLGSAGRLAASITLFVAALFVLISAGCALKVIFRAKSWAWDTDEVKDMPSAESVGRKASETQGTFLIGLTNRIVEESKDYERRSKWLDGAFATLVVALVSVVLHIGVYSVRTVQNPGPCRAATRAAAEQLIRPSAVPARELVLAKTTQSSAGTNLSAGESPFRPPRGGSCKR
jgi:hypothetical protein